MSSESCSSYYQDRDIQYSVYIVSSSLKTANTNYSEITGVCNCLYMDFGHRKFDLLSGNGQKVTDRSHIWK